MLQTLYTNPVRFFYTIKDQKLKQIFFRIWYEYHSPSLSGYLSDYQINYTNISAFRNKPDIYNDELIFTFIGRQVTFFEKVDWFFQKEGLLWAFNLHYFDFVNSKTSNPYNFLSLIKDWIANNSLRSQPGWAAYPTSLRIVNWIKFELNHRVFTSNELDSLFLQSRWLYHRIEYHIMGNHLLANAKALVFSGLFFSHDEADKWLKKGLHILNEELEEQINDDGCHFELSPMYQSIIVEDLIDLLVMFSAYDFTHGIGSNTDKKPTDCQNVNLTTRNRLALGALIEKINCLIPKMMNFLENMTHPDGELSFFNDAAIGIAPTHQQLIDYLSRNSGVLSRESKFAIQNNIESKKSRVITQSLGSSGFLKLNKGPFTLITNVAPITPPYSASHSHADTLSFELSYKKQRVLVNSGTSTYNIGELREFQRSTRAHNTVEIDDVNSSDVWMSFRVGQKARILHHSLIENDQEIHVSGSHSGYKTWNGGVIHKREWTLQRNRMICKDTLEGHYTTANLYFYFHPDITLESNNILATPNGERFEWKTSESNLCWNDSFWYPRFSESRKNLCLQISHNACLLYTSPSPRDS